MKYLIILLPILAIIACRKEVKLKLPEASSKPVVFAYISPDDTIIKVKVTRSMPLFEPFNEANFEPQRNAKVLLSNSVKEVQLAFNSSTGNYEIKTEEFAIDYGMTYKLKVTLQNGQTAEGETRVPSKAAKINHARYSLRTINTSTILNVFVSYDDDPSTANYYNLFVSSIDTIGLDTLYRGIDEREFSPSPEVQGGEQKLMLGLYDSVSVKRAIGFDCYLLNCSKDYYLFYKSVYSYSGGSPFSEPMPMYSNIVNGFGVFAAYASDKKRIMK
ncbi:MAG: DUF4249 domain-containing protein [Bacteroidia bacterium]|jgi:hypothetical protein|nr:DUF4249 domain-containing protein [Bacteroidia bacterium]